MICLIIMLLNLVDFQTTNCNHHLFICVALYHVINTLDNQAHLKALLFQLRKQSLLRPVEGRISKTACSPK